MAHPRGPAFAFGFFTLWLASAAVAADQSKPPSFAADVSIVSLPVFVADKHGRALRGLQAEDFELFDDGKKVPLVSFQYVDTSSPEEQALLKQAPAARRRFLLLFDLSFTTPSGLQRARDAAREFIRSQLAESDLAAVSTFDFQRGVRIVANFSEDRVLLAHAVSTLGAPALTRVNDPLSLAADVIGRDIMSGGLLGISESAPGFDRTIQAQFARRLQAAEAGMYRSQVLTLIGSLEELGRSLRGIEGRKQILYFSAGFDSKALVGFSNFEGRGASAAIAEGRIAEVDHESRYGDNHLRSLFSAMTSILSNADCVVHAVDVSGFGADNSLTQVTVTAEPIKESAGRDSLRLIASSTGGRLFADSHDLGAALREVAAMTSHYYIVGYQPQDLEGPGRFHKIKVKVARKNARLSHRTGYFERVPRQSQSVLQRKFEAAQLVMTGVGLNDLSFGALCLPFPARSENQVLGLVVQVPRDELRWRPDSPVSLELYGYAMAHDGRVLDHLAQLAQVTPELADPQRKAEGVSFYGTLHVPPGQYTIKLMVQEPETGSAGVQFLDVTVPPYDPRIGFLLPPVVMDDPARWLGLALGTNKVEKIDFPFELGGKPFLPRASFRVESGKPETLVLMAYDPSGPSDPAVSGIEIRSFLTDATGAPVRPGSMRIDRVLRGNAGRRTYVLAYTPEELTPGDYTLRIGVGEAETRLESFARVRVGPEPTAQ